MTNFIGQEIQTGKKYVYLKNERTGSSTIRKLKMIGKCIEVGKKVMFERLSYEGGGYFDKYGESQETMIDKLNGPEDVICEMKEENDETVVCGKWVADMTTTLDTVKCSVCKKAFQAYYSDYQYCPRCGAKMGK